MTAPRTLVPALLAFALLGLASPAFAAIWYRDMDGDGYGNNADWVDSATQPPGYVAIGGDCNDTNPSIHPGSLEVCNGVDDDCDATIDEGVKTTFYLDTDGDGYGTPSSTTQACSPPPGYAANATDCDDTNAAVHPGAVEVCNGIDDDCDGVVDEEGATLWYPDFDGDGFGDAASPVAACSQPPGYVSNAGDCDDTNDAVHPDAAESCNGIDDDCDGLLDEGACAPFQISGIADVGNDQGRRVRLQWNREDNDRPNMPVTITSYSVYRLVQEGLAKTPSLDATPPGTWDYVLSVPASGETSYSVVVPTLCDSTAGGICWSTFFVRAHTPAPLTSFDTAPAQGYSVDNLAPGVPQALVVSYSPSGNTLAWDGEAEPDLSHWRIYRSTDPDFVPSAATLVHSTASPQWTDGAGGATWHYKVTALDFAGNESAPAIVQATTDADGASIPGFRLHGAAPNPSRGNTLLSFDVPASGGEVELQVFDPSGRLAATLARGFHAAGTHRVQWDGRGGAGRDLPSGTYYLRLMTSAGTFSRRLTLVR